MSVQKCQKMKFPELGLPGVENVPTPRGIIFKLWGGPKDPTSQKKKNPKNPENPVWGLCWCHQFSNLVNANTT